MALNENLPSARLSSPQPALDNVRFRLPAESSAGYAGSLAVRRNVTQVTAALSAIAAGKLGDHSTNAA